MLGACVIFLSLTLAIQAEMESYIVGGSFSSINRYPHSAFLNVACVPRDGKRSNWICGSSILNQNLLLTAGHCVHSCIVGTFITVNVGNDNRENGRTGQAGGFLVHERYDARTSSYDIAMIKMKQPLKFDSTISRVALLHRPPYGEVAYLAGWGLTNENTRTQGLKLKHLDQKVWKHTHCIRLFGTLPKGTICASSRKQADFAAQGDSGSALVVRGYIQIGLVSYKVPHIANNVIIYTDIGYFYDWIRLNAKRLYCLTKI